MTFRELSIRSRLTASFVGVLALLAALVAVGVVAIVDRVDSVGASNHVNAELNHVQAQLYGATLNATTSIDLHGPADVVVQVVDLSQRHVLAYTDNYADEPVVAHAVADFSSANGLVVRLRPDRDHQTDPSISLGRVRVMATRGGPVLAFGFLYGSQLTHSHDALVMSILVSFPILLIVLAGLIWFMLGLTLAPIEAIRRRVESIAAADLTQRVPTPGGNDEVARLARTVNDMLARLESASNFQHEFISDASHELRSPLTTLLTTIERAQQNPDGANWPRVADAVSREGHRINAIVDSLFWLARHDEGQLESTRSEVDLDDLLFEEADRIRDHSSLTVATTGVHAVRVVGDLAMLRRAVRNLVDNASRYATSAIDLSVKVDGDFAVLRVVDDGPGIPAADVLRLFERFARADSARARVDGGTGLGLAIVKEISEIHGGTARFVPVERGACVEIRIHLGQ
jgi:signal transduction histidine kinase